MLKNDNLKIGFLLGFVVPLLVFVLIYLMRFSYYPFGEFLQTFRAETRLITFFAAWCIVANIGVFTLYINTHRYQTARGVFVMTIVYGLFFLVVRGLL